MKAREASLLFCPLTILSKTEVAKKLGFYLSNLSAMDSGRRAISLKRLAKIAAFLHCSIGDLIVNSGGEKKIFREEVLNDLLERIEASQEDGTDKSWVPKVMLAQKRHYAQADDFFLDNTTQNLKKAVSVLLDLRFHIATKKGHFDPDQIEKIVQKQETLVATNPQGVQIELLLRISGYAFGELSRDAAIFLVEGVPIRVGKLRKLLNSKKIAGREKDRLFLKRYQALLREKK